tara:strand:+ start:1960 stop:2340 length:381 start_codon:yes stop_codon:yes gene_type:complete
LNKLEEIKIDSMLDELVSHRTLLLLNITENQLQISGKEMTVDEKGSLSVMLYEGLYNFFKTVTKKYEKQIAHLQTLIIGKDSIYVANITGQIEKISETVHKKEQSAVYDIIHEWEKTLEGSNVQAN